MVLFSVPAASAQLNNADSLGFHFNTSFLGARSAAMANAQISDPAGDINAMYSNPAALLFPDPPAQLTANSLYNPSGNVMIQNLTTSLVSSENTFLGFGAGLQHRGSARLASAFGPYPNYNQYDFSLGYATKLYPTLSMGARVDISYGSTENAESWGSMAALGLLYAPSSSVSYGIIYKGTGYRENGLGSGLYYQATDDGTTMLLREELPHRLELGAALRFPSQINQPNFVLMFSNEKVFGEDGLIYRGGLEVFMTPAVSLRGGYFYSSPNAKGAQGGIGIDISSLNISYSYAFENPQLTGQFHQLSISLNM